MFLQWNHAKGTHIFRTFRTLPRAHTHIQFSLTHITNFEPRQVSLPQTGPFESLRTFCSGHHDGITDVARPSANISKCQHPVHSANNRRKIRDTAIVLGPEVTTLVEEMLPVLKADMHRPEWIELCQKKRIATKTVI
jgi:hypothetical protein